MSPLAALDAGSNTIVLLVGEVVEGRVRQVRYESEMVQIGADLHTTGAIGRERTERALAVFRRFLDIARECGARGLAAGATATVRRASDGAEFLRAASEAIDTEVRLLGEEEEAKLSFLGVSSVHAVDGRWLMADVGGASTELVVAEGRSLLAWGSAHLGSGSFSASHLRSDPPTDAERQQLRRSAAAALESLPKPASVDALAVTGTAPLRHLLPPRGDFSRQELEAARRRLNADSASVVGESTGLGDRRVRALRGAVEIIEALLDRSALDKFRISLEGVPHGMLLAYARRGEDWWRWPRSES